MRFQFIADHQEEFPVRRMCQVLDVSPGGYYAWCKRPVSGRKMANQKLFRKIKKVHDDSAGTYGSPRVYRELKDGGEQCSKNRVARLMRLRGLQAKQSKQFKSTTRRDKDAVVAPNKLKRDFTTDRPNQKWLADITYVRTLEGWLYLAVVLDLYGRRIVGWAMSKRMTSDLTKDALKAALLSRRPEPGLIHHSDQGSQYTAHDYQEILKGNGIDVSMNGAGTWYDNAPMESFFGTLKSELVHHRRYRTRDEARTDIFFYIEAFYNRCRRHSSLDYLSPEAYEQLYHERQKRGLSHCPQN